MANELEALEKRQLSAQRSLNDLTNQLTLADHLVYKKYLAELQNYGMVTLSQEMLNVQNAADCIRMYQLKELTLKKGEDMFQKLSTVYYSSMAQGCSLAVMIDVPEENRQQFRHFGHKGFAGSWWYCRHSGSWQHSCLGFDTECRCCHWPAAGYGGQSRRRHGTIQNSL